jgi:solute carrier family 25 oxoglutarate transporter 11
MSQDKSAASNFVPATMPKKNSVAMNFATSGLGGIAAWIVVHPFNTVAVQMNLKSMSASTSGAPAKPMSFPTFFSQMVKEQGAVTLYKGLGAGIIRQIFYATSRVGLFEMMRDEYKSRFGTVDLAGRMVCGVMSGGIAALISCPAEVTLVRLSNDAALPVNQVSLGRSNVS